MTLNLCSPWLSRLSPSTISNPPPLSKLHRTNQALFSLLFSPSKFSTLSLHTRASLSDNRNDVVTNEDLFARVSVAKDADEALHVIAETAGTNTGVVCVDDCRSIITSALDRGNAELALSVFYAMRSSFDQGCSSENGTLVERWKWSRPDVSVYTSLVQGLATSLKVSDAIRVIDYICRIGVSPAEEVPFGKVVRCPTCTVAVAVAQPQHGVQIASCANCRYRYELVSGNVVSIESEEIRKNVAFEMCLQCFLMVIYSCMVLILGFNFLRNYSCRTQHGYSSMGKGAEVSADIEAEHSCRY